MPNHKNREHLKKDFDQAYETHSDALFRYAFYKVSDKEKALDIVQDTFVRFWEYLAADGEVLNTKSFLYRIATNAIIDYYRKKKEVSLDDMADIGFDPIDHDGHHRILRSADSKLALELVHKLDEEARAIILMKYVDDLTVKEIAEIFEQRENTISVRLHRALKDLQDLFENND
ncbi:MAG: RNA polymerase sigma factor [Candidatus Taylorbacteria bacterium]|nr:RNA polymerase sigma factor [Candidatus Taylorbacteria bacterium]